jgi:uncharacterized protein (TIGR03086 family)
MGSPFASDGSDVLLDRHRRATARFARLVEHVRPEQWHAVTPCTAWDVRQLVNHVVGWNLFVAELVDGRMPADVLELIQRDSLGQDPVGATTASVARVVAAFAVPGALERIVHHPIGDLPGTYVVMMRVFDTTLHGWDLARAIGADESLDPELAVAVYDWALPQRDGMRASGAFAAEPAVAADADVPTRLLALVGRKA